MHFTGGEIIPRRVLCPWRAHSLASTLPAVARATAACFVRCECLMIRETLIRETLIPIVTLEVGEFKNAGNATLARLAQDTTSDQITSLHSPPGAGYPRWQRSRFAELASNCLKLPADARGENKNCFVWQVDAKFAYARKEYSIF